MKLTTNLTVENLLKNEKWTSQFDVAQLNMIRAGLNQGYDVSLFATPEFDAYQMRVILYCLYYGLTISLVLFQIHRIFIPIR